MQDELEQNRQHLVRALRAVETTTAETREEADAAMERVSEMETALEVQAETVRDLREQVYALQLRSASEHQRTMRIQEDDLGSLTQRVVRVEEQEHRVEEVALGLEKLGSWVQTTIQQRAVEYERQLSISNIAMQTYVQQQIESLCLAHMEDLRESVEQLRSENKHLHEQLANQRGHARSTGGDLLIEGGSPRLKVKVDVAHPEPGSNIAPPHDALRPRSPRSPHEANKDRVAEELAARDASLTAAVEKLDKLAGEVAALDATLHREVSEARAGLTALEAQVAAQAAASAEAYDPVGPGDQSGREERAGAAGAQAQALRWVPALEADSPGPTREARSARELPAGGASARPGGAPAPLASAEEKDMRERIEELESVVSGRMEGLETALQSIKAAQEEREGASNRTHASDSTRQAAMGAGKGGEFAALECRVDQLAGQVRELDAQARRAAAPAEARASPGAPGESAEHEETALPAAASGQVGHEGRVGEVEQTGVVAGALRATEDAIKSLAAQLEAQQTAQASLAEEVREQARARRASLEGGARTHPATPGRGSEAGPDPWAVEGRVSRLELALVEFVEHGGGAGEAGAGALSERLGAAEASSEHLVTGVQRLSATIEGLLAKQAELQDQLQKAAKGAGAAAGAGAGAAAGADAAPEVAQGRGAAPGIGAPEGEETRREGSSGAGGEEAKVELEAKVERLAAEQEQLRSDHQRLQAEVKRTAFLVQEALRGGDKGAGGSERLAAPPADAGLDAKADRRELADKADRKELSALATKAALQAAVAGLAERPAVEKLQASQLAAEDALAELRGALESVRGEVQALAADGSGRRLSGKGGGVAAMVGAFQSGVAPASAPAELDRATKEKLQALEQRQQGLERSVGRLQDSAEEVKKSMASTLEVAGEAFGDSTPFLMRHALEPLEADLGLLTRQVPALQAKLGLLEEQLDTLSAASGAGKGVSELDVARVRGELVSAAEMAKAESLEAVAALRAELGAKADRTELETRMDEAVPKVKEVVDAAIEAAVRGKAEAAALDAEAARLRAALDEHRAALDAEDAALAGRLDQLSGDLQGHAGSARDVDKEAARRHEEMALALASLRGEVQADVGALRKQQRGGSPAVREGADGGEASAAAQAEAGARLDEKADRAEVVAQREALVALEARTATLAGHVELEQHRAALAAQLEGLAARIAPLEGLEARLAATRGSGAGGADGADSAGGAGGAAGESAAAAAASAAAAAVSELEGGLARVREEVAAAGERLAVLEERFDAVQVGVDGLRPLPAEVAALRRQLGELDGAVDRLESNGALRDGRLANVERSLDSTRRDLDVEIRSARAGGSVSARSERSERALQELDAEISAASAGSARIRALRERVRGVTASTTSTPGSGLPPRPLASPVAFDPGSAAKPAAAGGAGLGGETPQRSQLEVTAEALREWEHHEARRSREASPEPRGDSMELSNGSDEDSADLEFV